MDGVREVSEMIASECDVTFELYRMLYVIIVERFDLPVTYALRL